MIAETSFWYQFDPTACIGNWNAPVGYGVDTQNMLKYTYSTVIKNNWSPNVAKWVLDQWRILGAILGGKIQNM